MDVQQPVHRGAWVTRVGSPAGLAAALAGGLATGSFGAWAYHDDLLRPSVDAEAPGGGQTAGVTSDDLQALCSAKGCSQPAAWRVVWNNPKLHTPDREKAWAACDGHRESLSHHLAIRSFLRRVEPVTPPSRPEGRC